MNKKVIIPLIVLVVIVLVFLAIQTLERPEEESSEKEFVGEPLPRQEELDRFSELETKIILLEESFFEREIEEVPEEIFFLLDDFFELERKILFEEISRRESSSELIKLERRLEDLMREYEIGEVIEEEENFEEN